MEIRMKHGMRQDTPQWVDEHAALVDWLLVIGVGTLAGAVIYLAVMLRAGA
jgi:hypothetical protein